MQTCLWGQIKPVCGVADAVRRVVMMTTHTDVRILMAAAAVGVEIVMDAIAEVNNVCWIITPRSHPSALQANIQCRSLLRIVYGSVQI